MKSESVLGALLEVRAGVQSGRPDSLTLRLSHRGLFYESLCFFNLAITVLKKPPWAFVVKPLAEYHSLSNVPVPQGPALAPWFIITQKRLQSDEWREQVYKPGEASGMGRGSEKLHMQNRVMIV